MTEPELHLGAAVVVPDVAAWRREFDAIELELERLWAEPTPPAPSP